MRIQHNIPAMNAYRNYNNNAGRLSKNLEKLSSGYRINRAGDDAAGLAISEKMRAQITGLDAAGKNVKDGVSLVKTAEGAMQEIHDMLGRMKYLATQSANGTYNDTVDRNNLQMEVDKLKQEIDRIADSANFNGQKLLDGSLDHTTVHRVHSDIDKKKGSIDMRVMIDGYKKSDGTWGELDVSWKATLTAGAPKASLDLTTGKLTINLVKGKATAAVSYSCEAIQDAINAAVAGKSLKKTLDDREAIMEALKNIKVIGKGVHGAAGNINAAGATTVNGTGTDLNLQIGDDSEKYNKMGVMIGDMHVKGLGLDTISIANQKDANKAVDWINDAINYVSYVRGGLGATQNRLEHTQNNLSVMRENIQDAEATIRDTDVADEMTAYTKNNILLQSAQAMLAQANQMPQGVLQLLQ